MLDEKNNWMMLDRDYPGRMQNQILILPILIGSRTSPAAAGPGLNVGQAASNYVSQVKTASNNLVNDMRGCRTTWSPSQTRCPSPQLVGRACTLVAAAIAPVPVPVHAPAPEVDDDPEGEVA